MHKSFELKEMELEQLQALATDLGMKSFKRLAKEDLVYAILDEEARLNSLNAPEKPAQKKRGRPKQKVEVEKTVEKPVEKPVEIEAVKEAKAEPKKARKQGKCFLHKPQESLTTQSLVLRHSHMRQSRCHQVSFHQH